MLSNIFFFLNFYVIIFFLQDASQVEKPKENFEIFKYTFPGHWQAFIDIERASRISTNQLAIERQKLTSSVKMHWNQGNNLLSFDGNGPSIETIKTFTDFDLGFEWKIPSRGDFVVLLKGVPGPRFWDFSKGPPETAKKGSGGLFLNKRFSPNPSQAADLSPDNWNHSRIRMRGDRVTVWLNGHQIVDGIPLENSWDRRKPIPLEGSVGFQGRGTPFDVRNMTIQSLEP